MYSSIILSSIVTVLIVYAWDYLDFPVDMLSRILRVSPDRVSIPKPFGCSLCLSTWTTIVIFICYGEFELIPLGFLFGFVTPYVLGLIQLVDKIIRTILIVINRILNSIDKVTDNQQVTN